MLDVIARLLQRLAGDRGQLRVAGAPQRLPVLLEPLRQQQVAQHGVGEVTAGRMRAAAPHRLLDQREVEVVTFLAQEGELVLVVPLPIELPGVREQRARLTQQVQREVGEGDVLLENGAVAAPFTQALGMDQAGVGQSQHVAHRGCTARGDGDGAGGAAVGGPTCIAGRSGIPGRTGGCSLRHGAGGRSSQVRHRTFLDVCLPGVTSACARAGIGFTRRQPAASDRLPGAPSGLTCDPPPRATGRRSGDGRPCLPSGRSTCPCRPGRRR